MQNYTFVGSSEHNYYISQAVFVHTYIHMHVRTHTCTRTHMLNIAKYQVQNLEHILAAHGSGWSEVGKNGYD